MATATTYRSFDVDPSAVRPFTLSWSPWLGVDTIDTSTWTISPTGPTLASSTHDDTSATVVVSDLAPGQTYRLTNHVVTASGDEDSRSLVLRCRAR